MFDFSKELIDCSKPWVQRLKIRACRLSQFSSMGCEGRQLQPNGGESDPQETNNNNNKKLQLPCVQG